MNHDLFDTRVVRSTGKRLHFDVIVRAGVSAEEAILYAYDWLASININRSDITSISNHFCHNAISSAQIRNLLNHQNYAIIKSKGCPGYYLD